MARPQTIKPTLYAISVGPGEPKLMTMQAIERLQQTPVVAWLQNPQGHSRAYAAAQPYIQSHQQQRPYTLSMQASPQSKSTTYDAIATSLKQELDNGKDVAFLVLGDVTLYASFHALALRLQGAYPIVMLPGISAISAGATYLGLSLAQQTDNLHILTPPIEQEQLTTLTSQGNTVVVMKPCGHLSAIRACIEHDPALDAVLIDNITLPTQRVVPLDSYKEDTAPYFSMLLLHRKKGVS
ncbi:MAG: precorrin-2 C(20)-methyltransferase [Alphaproteobacteria bacterium GM202ARS2]|nr:precorrin-2 C(20)-methyltransferase [Alphaproteobacteria bacterium GM202ARS2]